MAIQSISLTAIFALALTFGCERGAKKVDVPAQPSPNAGNAGVIGTSGQSGSTGTFEVLFSAPDMLKIKQVIPTGAKARLKYMVSVQEQTLVARPDGAGSLTFGGLPINQYGILTIDIVDLQGTAQFTGRIDNLRLAAGRNNQNITLEAVGASTIPGTTPGTTNPGTTPGTNPGTTPGTNPGTTPGTNPGTTPGTNPGTTPGTNPGTTPGTNPGTTPGTNPGTNPGTTPGTNPGATPGASTDLILNIQLPNGQQNQGGQTVWDGKSFQGNDKWKIVPLN